MSDTANPEIPNDRDPLAEIEDDDDTVEGDDVAPPVAGPELHLNTNDTDPTAGASDIGGRAGD
ncbi:MAG TPA: hypothetical protein VMD91_02040 [Candidatus Sulfotelmatobacter sp.]|nr:hypothetical protein [Candidatus Sulfotelmatobacter sp.]